MLFGCFQCVKGNKFESDSQLTYKKFRNYRSCFQCVKGNKFESDSQLSFMIKTSLKSCFQCVKGNKFESDSQLSIKTELVTISCFQCVKGNKFESDSQHVTKYCLKYDVVSNVSKVINLKAIHNHKPRPLSWVQLFPMCQR